ncbi:MAG: hypothetical protein JWM57_4240 [Phycisphaerales bacterium]|nr:hypothetical protein [Phycisphaerales bacterium]
MRVRLTCLATLVLTSGAFAQSPGNSAFSDLVPADSLVYFGWRGTTDPGPGFAGSKWESIVKDSQVGRLIDETIPAAGAAAERLNPRDGGSYRGIAAAVRQFIRKPSAAFVGFEDGHARGGILCRAGADTKELTQTLQQLVAFVPQQAQPRVVTPGDSVGLVFGYAADAAVEGGLDQQADFKKGLAQCVADPSTVMFINVKAARELADSIIEKEAPPENTERYRRFIEASGLAGVNSYVSAAGFADKEWQIDAYLDAPAPRKGLLAVTATTPLDADLLKHVPASANTVTVLRLNPNTALKTIRDVANETDAAAGDIIDKAIGGATMAIGKNLQDDLLASLGDQWAAYTSPEVGGTGAIGAVVVNKLANPAKAKQALSALSIFLSNSAKNLIKDKNITVAGRMTKVGDLSVFYAATPALSPAWTIKDGYLFLGAYPQTVIAAARYGGAPITDNAVFTAIAKVNGGHQPLAISYTDVKATLSEGYGLALLGSRTVLGLSDVFLAAAPEPVFPTLAAFQAQAGPASGSIWADDGGIHVRNRSPFPGAETMAQLSIANLYLTNAPMMASILLPSLNRSREMANRIKSSSNLRQIGLASMMYANTNKDKMPPDFSALLHSQEITVDVFINPRTGTPRPVPPAGANATDFYGAWANEQRDYVYVGAGKTTVENADHIVAYEKPTGLTDGINVLYFDGHVDFVAMAAVPSEFEKAGLPSPLGQ